MTLLEPIKQLARPFGIYVMTLTVAGAVFVPQVPVEKIVLAVTVLGTLAGLRTLDKQTSAGAR